MGRFSKKKKGSTPAPQPSGKISLAEAIRSALGIEPDVNAQDVARTEFYRAQLIRLVKGHLQVKGAPAYWDKTYLKEAIILGQGYVVVCKRNSEPLPLKCSAYGVNVFERPTSAVVANPVLGSFDVQLGVDGELIYIEGRGHGYSNLFNIIDVYAQKLASCDKSIDVNLFNTMATMIFPVRDDKIAHSIKEMFDQISQGKPAVFVDKATEIEEPTSIVTLKAKENFIADVVQLEKQRIVDEFLTLVGINNANTEKRERLITDEVNGNNDEVKTYAAEWNENLRDCCDKVVKMFPELAGLSIQFVSESTVDREESEVKSDDNVN